MFLTAQPKSYFPLIGYERVGFQQLLLPERYCYNGRILRLLGKGHEIGA